MFHIVRKLDLPSTLPVNSTFPADNEPRAHSLSKGCAGRVSELEQDLGLATTDRLGLNDCQVLVRSKPYVRGRVGPSDGEFLFCYGR